MRGERERRQPGDAGQQVQEATLASCCHRSILSTDRVEHEQLHAGSDDERRRHKLEHHGAEPGTTHSRAQHHSTARTKKDLERGLRGVNVEYPLQID